MFFVPREFWANPTHFGSAEVAVGQPPHPSRPVGSLGVWGWGAVWGQAASPLDRMGSLVAQMVKNPPKQETWV